MFRELKRRFSLCLEDLIVLCLLMVAVGAGLNVIYGNVLFWVFLVFLVYVGYRLLLRIREGEIKD